MSDGAGPKLLRGLAWFLERYGVLVAFAALFLWNAFLGDNADVFRRPENLRNMLNQNAGVGIVAVGMTLVMVAGGIDLSVGSLLALAAGVGLVALNALTAALLDAGWDPATVDALSVAAGFAVAILIGAAGGLLNGLLVTLGRLPSFIATLGGLVGFRSLTLVLADAGELRSASAGALSAVGRGGIPLLPLEGRTLNVTWNILAFAAVAIVGQVLLSSTRFGRAIVATGGNETAARYSAIAVDRVRLATFVLCGVCCGLAGSLQAARMNSVSTSQLGLSLELDAIAAVVIGGTSMSGGKGRVWATVVGVLILAMINNMLVVADVSPHWQGLVKGVIIVLAVLIQRGRRS